jgi:hypothetical protein
MVDSFSDVIKGHFLVRCVHALTTFFCLICLTSKLLEAIALSYSRTVHSPTVLCMTRYLHEQ